MYLEKKAAGAVYPDCSGKGGVKMGSANMDLDIKELQIMITKLQRSVDEVLDILMNKKENTDEEKEFYTVAECAAMKGGAALATFKSNRFLLPGCGNSKYEAYIGGRLCFPKDEVKRWLKVTDGDYGEYAESCGLILPDKGQKLIKKAKSKAE